MRSILKIQRSGFKVVEGGKSKVLPLNKGELEGVKNQVGLASRVRPFYSRRGGSRTAPKNPEGLPSLFKKSGTKVPHSIDKNQDRVETLLDGETVLAILSHHVRTGATVTMGFIEMLERTLSAEELDRPRYKDNSHGGPRTLQDVFERITCSQERMVLAVEKMEKNLG